MRRFPLPSAALAAGLVAFLTGCAGETPTSPANKPTPPNGGNCTVSIAMVATSQAPVAGSEVVVRAAVTRAGAAVPDGSSVLLTTDLGLFAENGLQTVSKTSLNGAADVTLFSSSPGPAHVKATFECASSSITITFSGVANQGPFISSYTPQSGSCAGGDTVTISGGQFGSTPGSVFFGGSPASVVNWGNASITVTTPIHALKDPLKPEQVNLVVQTTGNQTSQPVPFTYFCVAERMTIASINPIAGSPGGGDAVAILGSHFGSTTATTQVTFCGLPAQITGQADNVVNVTTPAHALANPALSESCPVVVTRDLGLVSMQSATSPVPFVYRGSGATGTCNTDPTFYVSSIAPNTGSPDGGTIVTVTGSGFPSSAALLKVDFGGNLGAIVGTPTSTAFQVSSPRRILAFPDVPETVDVIVTDLGSASQRCFRVAGGFVYTVQALDPSIYSVSPRTGPNDQSTRTTIFGANFQFPMQVFMTGGACGVQRVEASVIQVLSSQIVFNTPVAVGGNVCLSGQLVDVTILNPATGKSATCSSCFKYYSCPSVANAAPSVANATQSTNVVITGNNFGEPVIANVRVGGALVPLQVTSVSNTSIIVTVPTLQALLGGGLTCGNTDAAIELTFPGLVCANSPISVPFSFHTDQPTATTASPASLNQDGSPSSAIPGSTPATITVVGTNFQAPMTVTLIKDGNPVPNTPVNNANVSNPTSLSFSAPAVPNGSLNLQNCGSGGVVNGVKFVPTSFGIRVRNTLTGCTVDLPNVLVYNPSDTTCRAPLTISPSSVPAGQATVAYGPVTLTAAGGGGAPYSWSVASGALPGGMSLATATATTATLSGTPAAAGTYTFTVMVQDATALTATNTYSLVINP